MISVFMAYVYVVYVYLVKDPKVEEEVVEEVQTDNFDFDAEYQKGLTYYHMNDQDKNKYSLDRFMHIEYVLNVMPEDRPKDGKWETIPVLGNVRFDNMFFWVDRSMFDMELFRLSFPKNMDEVSMANPLLKEMYDHLLVVAKERGLNELPASCYASYNARDVDIYVIYCGEYAGIFTEKFGRINIFSFSAGDSNYSIDSKFYLSKKDLDNKNKDCYQTGIDFPEGKYVISVDDQSGLISIQDNAISIKAYRVNYGHKMRGYADDKMDYEVIDLSVGNKIYVSGNVTVTLYRIDSVSQ